MIDTAAARGSTIETFLGYHPEASDAGRFTFWSEDQSYEPVRKLINAVLGESDRGSVIVGMAFVEDILKQILVQYAQASAQMEKVTENLRFAVVSDLCLSLGLISSEERSTLKVLSKVRNDFAHNVAASFKDDRVIGSLNSLKFAKFKDGMTVQGRDRFLANLIVLMLEVSDRREFLAKNPMPEIEIRRLIEPVWNS